MRKARRILPLLLVFMHSAAFAQQAINWEGTIDSAKANAGRSNRLVLLFFTADWCPNCHRLENGLINQPGAVAALQANYVPVKLNYDYFQNTARQFGVTRLPTTIVLAPGVSGGVLAVIPEALPIDQYLSKLNQVAADAKRRNAGVYAQIQAGPTGAGNPMPPNAVTPPPNFAPRPNAMPPANTAGGFPPNGQFRGNPPASPVMPFGAAPAAGQINMRQPSTMATPALGLDGYCPVRLFENDRWQKGDAAWGMVHRGRVYLFTGSEERRRFAADPDRYAPVNSGNDVVLAVEISREVPGVREHGAKFGGHVFLFANEESLKKFASNPAYYADRALQAIRPAPQNAALR